MSLSMARARHNTQSPQATPHDLQDPWNPAYEPADSHWCSSRQSSSLFLRGFRWSSCRLMKTFVQR
ncbi:hypothetical protein K443DRAFT_516782 [Laccaria amethystina LaAM-08-1]|uniref:Uncharacterized protein n=1 Tax=Laccaria amethystina LaAM-08-1 TaxID=1095629 RepID=A0A0C9WZT9_9AGAR|nr:hypothetical protein K443DRAFT_516782 [Laccaria amethystina LaAM-08-1]